MVTFDVKGAFNGVAGDVLIERLRRCRIPKPLVCWIEDFLKNRQAMVIVNGTSTDVAELQHASLPQGSPFSPIFYILFNADLVKSKIKKNRGAIAFIDDYLAWVTSDSIQSNVNLLQLQIIPHVESWAKANGTIFQAKKTHMTHFTQNNRTLTSPGANQLLLMGEQVIESKPTIKILGVTLDQGFKYRKHILGARDKGIKAALAPKRLKNLRPEVARKLFHSKVTSITDYASPIWGPAAAQYTIDRLDKVQRIGAQAITGAFSTVSLLIAESEALLAPTQARIHRQELNTWIKWHTKPLSHRFWKAKRAINLANNTWISPLQKTALRFSLWNLSNLETIKAYAKPPWMPPVRVKILDKSKAIELAAMPDGNQFVAFTDSSTRNKLVGIGVQWLGRAEL